MFFFVMGLELKREFIGGELRDLRKVTLPVAAAVMGMLLSAGIYLLFNLGTPVAHGWEIPMATDIAFALAVLYMLGNRVPISAKVFLTTLAIVDALGSVVVIALFYTSHISVGNLVVGLSFLLVMFVGNRLVVKKVVLRPSVNRRCLGGFPHVGHPCHHLRRSGSHGHPCRLPHPRGCIHSPHEKAHAAI